MKNILIIGASKGLGLHLSKGLPNADDTLWILSRTAPPLINIPCKTNWIKADLSHPKEVAKSVQEAIGSRPLQCLIYNAGKWENNVMAQTTLSSLLNVMDVNLNSAIAIIKQLEPNIKSGCGNVFLVGSTCGLENEGANIPGYVSSKFGLRGLAYALRENFRKSSVRVTCISPGSMATSDDGIDNEGKRIPMEDMVSIFKCFMGLSSATCPKELILPATQDTDV